ncbi:MAG: SMR family transporter [Pseudomonadota bacterium]
MSFKPYLFLGLAIVFEVIGTTALKECNGFTRLWPSIIVVVAYAISFLALALTLRSIPVGLAYAIWSGVGIVLIAAIGWVRFNQTLDTPALIGLLMIIAGIVVINGFSKSLPH